MLYAILISIHLLGALIWVGGMAFSHFVLRPALLTQDPAVRLDVFAEVFPRYFRLVWPAIIGLHVSGWGIVLGLYGGLSAAGVHVHAMLTTGSLMTVVFIYLFFGPYARFRAAMLAGDRSHGPALLARVRVMVNINLTLGIITSVLGAGGAYWH